MLFESSLLGLDGVSEKSPLKGIYFLSCRAYIKCRGEKEIRVPITMANEVSPKGSRVTLGQTALTSARLTDTKTVGAFISFHLNKNK